MNNLEYLSKYLSTLELEGYSSKTIKIYKIIIQNFLSSFSKPISEITTSDIRSYLSNYKTIHNISNVTLSNYQHYISSFFNWVTKEGYLSQNPCLNLRPIKTPKVIKDGFTEQEMAIIRKNCCNIRQKALVETLYSSGLRVSELVSLNKEDINWDRGITKVVGKGNKERDVYFSDDAIKLLKEYLQTREDNNEALFVTLIKPIKRMTIDAVENSLRALGGRCGIHVHPHRFRHTCATVLLERGMPIQDVSEILGHSKLETTMIYCTLNKKKIMDKYNECMNGARAK